jgi:hypothetical protein
MNEPSDQLVATISKFERIEEQIQYWEKSVAHFSNAQVGLVRLNSTNSIEEIGLEISDLNRTLPEAWHPEITKLAQGYASLQAKVTHLIWLSSFVVRNNRLAYS